MHTYVCVCHGTCMNIRTSEFSAFTMWDQKPNSGCQAWWQTFSSLNHLTSPQINFCFPLNCVYFYSCIYVCACLSVFVTFACNAHRSQDRVFGLLDLELQTIVSQISRRDKTLTAQKRHWCGGVNSRADKADLTILKSRGLPEGDTVKTRACRRCSVCLLSFCLDDSLLQPFAQRKGAGRRK